MEINFDRKNLNELINKSSYDFLREDEHLGDNIILLGLSGSHAYGTNVEGSDIDIRGIALPNKREILLGNSFEQVSDMDTDTVVYSFDKIMNLLANANPNVIEMLALNKEHYIKVSEIGQELIDNRDMFLSKKVVNSFLGFVKAQLRRLDNKSMRNLSQSQKEVHILNSIKSSADTFRERYFTYEDDAINLYIDDAVQEDFDTEVFMDIKLNHYPLRDYKSMWSEMSNIVKEYAKIGKKDTKPLLKKQVNKHAMHAIRLMNMCVEILETCDFTTYREADHDLLMAIRNGEYMGEDNQMRTEFFEMVDSLEKRIEYAKQNTDLPDKPDFKRIEDFTCNVHEKVVLGDI